MKILVDTNVLMDYLVGRKPYFEDADRVIKLCIDCKIEGYMAAHSITDMFYILRKDYKESGVRRMMIKSLFDILDISGIDKDILLNALNRESFEDFEDCVQDECADSFGADYIVTRNTKDFENSKVQAITPDDFLKLIDK